MNAMQSASESGLGGSLSKAILVAATILLGMSAISRASPRPEGWWKFSSPYGHEIAISYDSAREEFATRTNDVTSRGPTCEGDKYVVCMSDRLLTIAIPSEPAEPGSRWSEGSSSFEMIAKLDHLQLLGAAIEDVYVIDARRDGEQPFEVGTHVYRLLFSRSHGLIAFGEIEDGKELVLYFAESLPSLGAATE